MFTSTELFETCSLCKDHAMQNEFKAFQKQKRKKKQVKKRQTVVNSGMDIFYPGTN